MVEFAVVFPIFLLLTFGLLDLGRAVWQYNTLEYIARDAARQAELSGTVDLTRCNTMFNVPCTKTIPSPANTVLVTTASCPNPSVTATYTFQPIISFIANFPWVQSAASSSGIPLTATEIVPLVPGVCTP
jgi:Flp pilus assembly protein TadG